PSPRHAGPGARARPVTGAPRGPGGRAGVPAFGGGRARRAGGGRGSVHRHGAVGGRVAARPAVALRPHDGTGGGTDRPPAGGGVVDGTQGRGHSTSRSV